MMGSHHFARIENQGFCEFSASFHFFLSFTMDPLKFMFKNNNKFAQSVKQAASQGAKNAANGDGVGGGMLGGIGALVFGTLAVGFLGYESLYTGISQAIFSIICH